MCSEGRVQSYLLLSACCRVDNALGWISQARVTSSISSQSEHSWRDSNTVDFRRGPGTLAQPLSLGTYWSVPDPMPTHWPITGKENGPLEQDRGGIYAESHTRRTGIWTKGGFISSISSPVSRVPSRAWQVRRKGGGERLKGGKSLHRDCSQAWWEESAIAQPLQIPLLLFRHSTYLLWEQWDVPPHRVKNHLPGCLYCLPLQTDLIQLLLDVIQTLAHVRLISLFVSRYLREFFWLYFCLHFSPVRQIFL